MTLRAQPINCTLKRSSDEPSSTDKMIGLIDNALKDKAVEIAPTIRIVDHNVLPVVTSDEGEGDDWTKLRAQILTADLLGFGTPVWLGQPSSIAKRVLERLYAFLRDTDEQGRSPSPPHVSVVAIGGDEE